MSTYYASKINYLVEDFMTEAFEFQEVKKELVAKLTEGKIPLWNSLSKLTMKLTIVSPDIDTIMEHYSQGSIKSHEFDATVEKITDIVKSAVSILTGKIVFTVNCYEVLRNAISIQHYEEFSQENEKHTQRIDTVIIHFNPSSLEVRDVVAFFNLWNLGEYCFARQLSVEFTMQEKNRANPRILMRKKLEKRELVDSQQYITPNDTEVLEHQCYQKILNTYMFPEGMQSKAEITLDLAQEDILPKKRRMVSYQGTKARFHDMLSKYTPYEKYQQIIKENNIAGVYLSVRSTNDEILYLLIDIDVPSLFFGMFPRQVLWQLILNVVNALKKTVAQFGLPPFKVSFSGNKGVHLLWAVSPNAILDYERHVNLPELSEGDIPGINALKKEKVSTINDGFKFTKSLLQSILLYTVYKGYISIPKEIIKKLRVFYPYQIFRLNKDSKNCLSILLDCSSQNKGVFRLFSPHPATKRVSIPISDLEQNEVLEEYHSFQTVLEEAKMKKVLERFDNNEIELFLQYPNYITRDHIREVLRPDKLYPSFEILLRFGTMYAIERSPPSFSFWHRFYELKSFYKYCERFAFSYQKMGEEGIEPFEMEMEYIEAMGTELQIKQLDSILSLLRMGLTQNILPFPIIKHMLESLYYTEFFFDLKSNVFLRTNQESLITLFSNELEFTNFLNQTNHLFNIAADTIIRIILGDNLRYSDQQIQTIQKFSDATLSLLEIARSYLGEIRQNQGTPDKEEKLLYTVYFVSNLYFATRDFLREFHNIGEEESKWR